MTGISSTGMGLPSPASLFGSGAATSGAPAMGTTSATTVQPSTQDVPGFTVTGQAGGTTTLPAESPADFQSANPTALDQPHPQYPGLIKSHVAVLQAIGTPEAVIAQLNASQPQAEYLERYIQGEIMQNPEGWDAVVGNPSGTARAGLQKLMPGVQLPAPGTGNPGVMPDGSSATGMNVPGIAITQPSGEQQGISGETIVKGLFWAGIAAGVGFLGWKFLKNRNAAKEAAAAGAAALGGGAAAGAAAGGGAAAALHAGGDALTSRLGVLGDMFKAGGAGGAGAAANAEAVARLATLNTLSTGLAGGAGATADAATAWGVLHGLAPGDGHVMSIHAAAKFSGISETLAHKMSMESRWMGVLEQLTKNGGTLGDAAAAGVLAQQATGVAGGAASAVPLAGFKQLLAGMANSIA